MTDREQGKVISDRGSVLKVEYGSEKLDGEKERLQREGMAL